MEVINDKSKKVIDKRKTNGKENSKKIHLEDNQENQDGDELSFGELVKKYIGTEKCKEFRRLKFRGKIYELNEVVFIQNQSDINVPLIGVIQNIMLINHEQKIHPILDLAWHFFIFKKYLQSFYFKNQVGKIYHVNNQNRYYRKKEIPAKKYQNYLDSIGEQELFLSNHKDFVSVDTITGAATVLSYNDYDQLENTTSDVFYARAKFDIKSKMITDPPIEDWDTQCICQKPLNPDQLYIQCDACNNWYHQACIGITSEEAEKIDSFNCENCKKKTNND